MEETKNLQMTKCSGFLLCFFFFYLTVPLLATEPSVLSRLELTFHGLTPPPWNQGNDTINQLYLNTVNGSVNWFSDIPCDNYNL